MGINIFSKKFSKVCKSEKKFIILWKQNQKTNENKNIKPSKRNDKQINTFW